MQPVFGEAKRLLEEKCPFVLATVVATKGSTPQKPGAKLLVRGDGSIVGTLGGGCVEADVWGAARSILEGGGGRELRRFVLDEDIAAKDGLVCGGVMEIFIEPVLDEPEFRPLVDEILGAYEGKGDCGLANVISGNSTGDGEKGRLFIRADGSTEGTLGSGELDELARRAALVEMPRGRECSLEAADGSRVYVETFTTPATVVIAGGGHVGKAISTLAHFLGFRTIIVDDRPKFAREERFPEADQVVLDYFDAGLRGLNLGPNHFVVVATRGHKHDDAALLEAARSGAGYIGLLGSKRKSVMIFRDLIRQGIAEERIRRIRAPVGLDLGGRQPEEIAASILAEILAVRYERSGGPLSLAETVIDQAKRLAAR
ncbi:MAG: XdhC family protein [Planctomycetota bacterium]|nr:XdhC family protein [Planctomycetota bacterium]